jgi:hypothetical protein
MLNRFIIIAILVLSCFAQRAAGSDPVGPDTVIQSQELKIQSLEQELLSLNMELQILEEDLLYPASSRVAVYMAMDVGQLFALDAVTVKLNGIQVDHHLYTARQVDALHRGGIQRLYVGNARQGENQLTAFFLGKGPGGRDYKRAASVSFEQSFEPVYIQLTVSDSTKTRQPEFRAEVR